MQIICILLKKKNKSKRTGIKNRRRKIKTVRIENKVETKTK